MGKMDRCITIFNNTCHNVWDNGHCISKIYLQNTIIDTMRLFDCKIEGNL